MNTNKNIPALRFPEFKGEWDKKKLGEVSDISKLAGYEYTKHVVYSDVGKTIALRAMNIKNNSLDLRDVKYIDGSDFSKLNRSKLFIGDLMFTYIGANIGDVALINENDRFYLAPNVARVRSNEKVLNYSYLIQYFNIPSFLKQEIHGYIASSSQPALSMESIRKFKIGVPTLPEQTRIASFFTLIDKKIFELKQKKNLLEQYKKGVMQKIFSRDGRDAINCIFTDDNGKPFPKWEKKKLGEVALKKSSNIAANKIEDNFGDYIIYGASGVLKRIDFYEEENDYISIIKDGAGVGRIFYCAGKSSVLGTMEIIKPKIELHTYFLFCLLNNIDFVKYVTGSTIPHIYFKDYSKEICEIPSIKEQTKIANFLSAIDEKINHTQKQIEKTEEWKKGLFQQMFC
jgi:type I restriction enzyme S subunit